MFYFINKLKFITFIDTGHGTLLNHRVIIDTQRNFISGP